MQSLKPILRKYIKYLDTNGLNDAIGEHSIDNTKLSYDLTNEPKTLQLKIGNIQSYPDTTSNQDALIIFLKTFTAESLQLDDYDEIDYDVKLTTMDMEGDSIPVTINATYTLLR